MFQQSPNWLLSSESEGKNHPLKRFSIQDLHGLLKCYVQVTRVELAAAAVIMLRMMLLLLKQLNTRIFNYEMVMVVLCGNDKSQFIGCL